jgi:uncharacterized protein (TIGR00266 family)
VHVRIDGTPSYAVALITLSYDEVVYIERGAIGMMSEGIDLHGTFGGDGVVHALKRKVLGGESLLFTEAHAQVEGVWLYAAPPYPGDVNALNVSPDSPLLVESGSLLAYSKGVVGDVHYSGLKTVLLHEGITMLETTGEGLAIVSAVGAILKSSVAPGISVIVDTGHLVAFSAGMNFDVGALGSLTTAVTSGEGLVARLTGPGDVYFQTRAEQQLRTWLLPPHDQNTGPRQ